MPPTHSGTSAPPKAIRCWPNSFPLAVAPLARSRVQPSPVRLLHAYPFVRRHVPAGTANPHSWDPRQVPFAGLQSLREHLPPSPPPSPARTVCPHAMTVSALRPVDRELHVCHHPAGSNSRLGRNWLRQGRDCALERYEIPTSLLVFALQVDRSARGSCAPRQNPALAPARCDIPSRQWCNPDPSVRSGPRRNAAASWKTDQFAATPFVPPQAHKPWLSECLPRLRL